MSSLDLKSGFKAKGQITIAPYDANGNPTGQFFAEVNPVELSFNPGDTETVERISKMLESEGQALDSDSTSGVPSLTITTDDARGRLLAIITRGDITDVTQAATADVTDTVTVSAYDRFVRVDSVTQYFGVLETGLSVKANEAVAAPGHPGTTQAVALNAVIIPATTNPNGYYFKCSDDGTTGGTAPASWDVAIGATVTDGTVIWTCKGKHTFTETTDFVYNRRKDWIMPVSTGGIQITGSAAVLQVIRDVPAATGFTIAGSQNPVTTAEVEFEGRNVSGSQLLTFRAGKVKLGSLQEVALVGDEWAQFQLGGTIETPTGQAPYNITQVTVTA